MPNYLWQCSCFLASRRNCCCAMKKSYCDIKGLRDLVELYRPTNSSHLCNVDILQSCIYKTNNSCLVRTYINYFSPYQFKLYIPFVNNIQYLIARNRQFFIKILTKLSLSFMPVSNVTEIRTFWSVFVKEWGIHFYWMGWFSFSVLGFIWRDWHNDSYY